MTGAQACRSALFILMGAASLGLAQAPPSNPDSALQSILSQIRGTPLALDEAKRIALTSSPSARIAEAGLAAAAGVIRHEKGAFDPRLSLSWMYADEEQPAASFFAGATTLHTLDAAGNAGLRWTLPFGTDIEAALNIDRLSTNSSFAFLSPQYTSIGSLTIRQPLLRGFGVSTGNALESAERAFAAARARYDQEVLMVDTQVEQLYWDLYAGERDYAVQLLTRDRAAAFLKDTELRAHAGLVGPNQVANARTFLAEQELLLLDREEQLDRLSDLLANAVGVRPVGSSMRYLTSTSPQADYPLPDPEGLVQDAFQRNLDLQAVQSDIEAKRHAAKAAGWDALPDVDLVGGIGGYGLAGSAHEVIFGTDTLRTTVGGGFGDALRQVVKRDFPTWHVGVEVNIPIGLRQGLGDRDRADAELVIAEQRLAAAKRILDAEIRAGCRELLHGSHRLATAREGVNAAQEQVRIGLIEFQNGRATAFELVRLGADFAIAQQRYSQALVRSAKAAAALRQLTSGAFGGGYAPGG
jgi:outer membrane protein TolC